jgi:hypothetical protein
MYMKKIVFILFCAIFIQAVVFSGGGQASSSAERGSYLAGLGRVIPPEEINVDHYIAPSDYNYPIPNPGALNVIPAAGFKDNMAYLLIGLRGKKDDFSALPPMNISFGIDISGSMSSQDKLDWVKESFHIFIEKVRPQDFVSVVIFDNLVEILIAPTQIRSQQDRDRFKRQVDNLRPRGGTNIYGGMEMGYQQVQASYRANYTNRVILLSDGEDNASGKTKKDFLDACTRYKEQGINISTIALGASADISLMVDMAVAGGGSSRFISDRTVMEQTFGSELDRLVVTAARNLSMELVLSDGVALRETWGYSYWTSGKTIHYTLDTLHNGDYETIVAEAVLDRPIAARTVLGNFFLNYEDITGRTFREGPYPIILNPEPGGLVADARVREAEGYIALARGLIDIGTRANGITKVQQDFNRLRNERTAALRDSAEGETVVITDSPEMSIMRKEIIGALDYCLGEIGSLSAHLTDISASLDNNRYAPELRILGNYRNSFTNSLESYSREEQ